MAFGIDGMALQWIQLILSKSAISAMHYDRSLDYGAALRLDLCLSCRTIFDVISECGLVGHCRSDDTQTSVSLPPMQRLQFNSLLLGYVSDE